MLDPFIHNTLSAHRLYYQLGDKALGPLKIVPGATQLSILRPSPSRVHNFDNEFQLRVWNLDLVVILWEYSCI